MYGACVSGLLHVFGKWYWTICKCVWQCKGFTHFNFSSISIFWVDTYKIYRSAKIKPRTADLYKYSFSYSVWVQRLYIQDLFISVSSVVGTAAKTSHQINWLRLISYPNLSINFRSHIFMGITLGFEKQRYIFWPFIAVTIHRLNNRSADQGGEIPCQTNHSSTKPV